MSNSHNPIPLVSCICPTLASRARDFLPRTIRCFESQDYPALEMVLVGDEEWFSARLVPGTALRISAPIGLGTVGEKRNTACDLAHGSIICHFDDDDWSRPDRVSHQVALLQASGKQVVGYNVIAAEETRQVNIITEEGKRAAASKWWRWRVAPDDAAGTSLCYRKEWWQKHPFLAVNYGEDRAFFAEAYAAGTALSVDGEDRICATNHAGNVSGRLIGGLAWEELPGSPYGELYP